MQFGNGWKPAVAPAAGLDVLRVGLGAALGLGVAAALVQLAQWGGWQGGWGLFAPLGATAVLVFAVALAQLTLIVARAIRERVEKSRRRRNRRPSSHPDFDDTGEL